MGLGVIVDDGSGLEKYVEVDDLALCFFDSFIAAVSPLHEFSWFEYEDDEGDMVAVRTDDELAAMIASVDHNVPIHIFAKCEIAIDPPSLVDVDNCTVMPDALKRLSLISSGNSGTLYKTLDTNTDQIIAVKCISLDGSQDILTDLQRETNILRQCSASPFIVKFLSAILLDGELCLCMEYMDGGSLDRYGKLPPEVLAPVTVSIINGLAFLWGNKVMHRDVKPSNILVNSAGEVKLADFGVSKQLEQSIARSFVGTNAYMAPERLLGAPYRICSDIWSLGLTLCELAIGRFPLASSSEALQSVMQRISTGNVDVSDELRSEGCAADFCDVVLNCVILEEGKRWPPDKLIACRYIRQNVPINQQAVIDFVIPKNLLFSLMYGKPKFIFGNRLSLVYGAITADDETSTVEASTSFNEKPPKDDDRFCSTVNCSEYASCLSCTFPECNYGETVVANCLAKPTCKERFFGPKLAHCRYCWQLEPEDYTCNPVIFGMRAAQVKNCSITSARLFRTVCQVHQSVFCKGRRIFFKRIRCNWSSGYVWWKAMLYSIILGGFGADRFYLGLWKSAFGKLFSFGGLGIWTVIDVILVGVGYVGPADGSVYI
ncbi:unnamed protein product [Enterobius vermicularis]|uniref:mitogen-activated protein kinase kinase n=1 Tax=Enterobius vermicularis TaxID=51028 RepID=A0A0N4V7M7_ENTVE|nr:unnamed protein product [Enterobius vermicularis]